MNQPNLEDLGPRDPALPLAEAVFRLLREGLHRGVFRCGSRLREEDVAKALKVSRTPVREAFARLAAKRLLEPSGGRGLTFRTLDTLEVMELYALREILEGACARLAARQASDAEIETLDELAAGFLAATGNPHDLAHLNRLFHEAIFRAARNRYLDMALSEMQDAIALLGPTTFGVEGRPSTAAAEHARIVDAITRRDADGAELAAREHIREALRARLRIIQSR